MALLWVDGFDNYGTTVNSAPSPTNVLSSKYFVTTPAAQRIQDGFDSGYALQPKSTGRVETPALNTTNRVLTVGFHFKLASVSTNEVLFMFTNKSLETDASFEGLNIRNRSGGDLAAYRTGTQLGVTTNLGLTVNTWHYLEAQCFCNTSGTFTLKIDNVSVLSLNANTQQSATVNFYNIFVFYGVITAVTTVDNFYVCDGTGNINNDFLGPKKVVTIRPNGDSSSNWAVSTGGSNYTEIDEEVSDEDTTYIETDTSGDKALFDYEGIASGTINGLMVTTEARFSGTQGYGLKHVIDSNSNELVSSNMVAGEGYVSLTEVFEQDHDASANWTQSTINAAKFGVQVG